MSNKKKTYLLFGVVVIILPIVIFLNLSDIYQAKISLKILGIHKENKSKYSNVSELILDNKYVRCNKISEIRQQDLTLLENYLNSTRFQKDTIKLKLRDVYTGEDELWSSGCQPSSDLPMNKFVYLLYSDNSLIVCSLSGGIGVSTFYEFFEINSGKLELKGVLNFPTMFILALKLRFDSNLLDWTEE